MSLCGECGGSHAISMGKWECVVCAGSSPQAPSAWERVVCAGSHAMSQPVGKWECVVAVCLVRVCVGTAYRLCSSSLFYLSSHTLHRSKKSWRASLQQCSLLLLLFALLKSHSRSPFPSLFACLLCMLLACLPGRTSFFTLSVGPSEGEALGLIGTFLYPLVWTCPYGHSFLIHWHRLSHWHSL